MEFSFEVSNILPGKVIILETAGINSVVKIYNCNKCEGAEQELNEYQLSYNTPWDTKLKRKKEELSCIIDEFGRASALAQNLRTSITTLEKFVSSRDQKIYLLKDCENTKFVIGFLKIGRKRLFLCDENAAYHEEEPQCLLDFYVHESKQRCGFGYELFNTMLQNEGIRADHLAIDRPSFKLLSFLKRHYNLTHCINQTNKFVIFPTFFMSSEALQTGKVDTSGNNNIQQGSDTIDTKALESIKMSPGKKEFKKSQTYYSSAANCLIWNDDGEPPHCKNYCSLLGSSTRPGDLKSHSNWNLHSVPQTCSTAHKTVESWNISNSMPGSSPLTPVNTDSVYSQRNWNRMQSSWNVLGVKPMDYTYEEPK